MLVYSGHICLYCKTDLSIAPSLNFGSLSTLFFRNMLVYSGHICLYCKTDFLRCSSRLILCYGGNLLQSIRLYPFWARPSFAPVDMHNLASFVMSVWGTFWMLLLSSSFISFFSPFPSSMASALVIISVASEFGPCGISSSWCVYCYRSYTQTLGLLFSGFWVSVFL